MVVILLNALCIGIEPFSVPTFGLGPYSLQDLSFECARHSANSGSRLLCTVLQAHQTLRGLQTQSVQIHDSRTLSGRLKQQYYVHDAGIVLKIVVGQVYPCVTAVVRATFGIL